HASNSSGGRSTHDSTHVTFTIFCAVRFFFFNDTATTEIYTLPLHDALPILFPIPRLRGRYYLLRPMPRSRRRSEEHTSELQSLAYLVCPLLREKNVRMR